MSDFALQHVALIFGCALPMSMFFWALLIVSLGRLTDRADQPASFRPFAFGLKGTANGGRSYAYVGAGLFGLGLVNFTPIALLIWRPYGLTSVGTVLAYLALQGLWLSRVWSAIQRAKSRDRGR